MRHLASIINLATIVVASRSAGASEVGYYSQPALHGDRVVFVSEGDLWSAGIPEDEGAKIVAYRLSTAEGRESHPRISPDGTTVAFTAEFEGNRDVYTIGIDGGNLTRLTFHPGEDICVGWMPDGASVLFRSGRQHHFGRPELWRVSVKGGMPERYDFGECSLAAVNQSGKVIAFNQWSNENWTWKGYRGGTAPEIWIGEFASNRFWRLTADPANDLFPMWIGGRVFYLSDRSGQPNIFSDSPAGGDLKQHTRCVLDPEDPTAADGYDIRWPSADADIRGTRIIFAQAADLVLLDTRDDSIRRLDVQLATDRLASRRRFAEPQTTLTEFALSASGTQLLIGTRGELIRFAVHHDEAHQLTHTSGAREWGASFIDEDRIIAITDEGGEQQIAVLQSQDGAVSPLTTDRADWLFPPVVSPDGLRVAFADKTQRLHLMNIEDGERDIIDRSDAWEITDYRFSPDGQWLAYMKPAANGFGRIYLYSVRTGRSFPVSDGQHNEHHPRFDPKGQYLYFLAESELNPRMDRMDFEGAFIETTEVYAVPLSSATPPPQRDLAERAGFDLEGWSNPDSEDGVNRVEVVPAEDDAEPGGQPEDNLGPLAPMRVDVDGMADRAFRLCIDASNYTALEAVYGGVVLLREPVKGLLDQPWPPPPPGVGDGVVLLFDVMQEEATTVAENVTVFRLSAASGTIGYPVEGGIAVKPVRSEEEPEIVEVNSFPLRIDATREWRHIFVEAWRLQRDFYWAANMAGLDWHVVRTKYEALLDRVATRVEVNDLIGEMIGELRTSHTYIWGGEEREQPHEISVGLLGADISVVNGQFRIDRIIPGKAWDDDLRSPLALAHLDVNEGDVITAINGQPLGSRDNIFDHLQGQANKIIGLTIRASSGVVRTIEIRALSDESAIRYAAWVEANRAAVAEASQEIGYLHLPDMDAAGLVAFGRQFYGQIDKKALVIDVRNNGGGFVSQMIIERLARKIWAYQQPRHGRAYSYPDKALHGHLAVLIDQHAGSDGDIFPESFRILSLGPLIGTRTWGGVVGIRADKPFLDMGVSTQPEFAWWTPTDGWSLENQGVAPDIEVAITPGDRQRGVDPQFQAALEFLKKKLEKEPMERPQPPEFPVRRR